MPSKSVQQIPKLEGKTFEKLQQHGLVLVCFANATAVCLEGDPPPVFTHHQADNPYKSLYGSSWEEEVDKGLVYHDTLVLTTCADSVSYMKEKSFYKHWIFPELDLMANPLDTSLFSQLNCAGDQHVLLTQGFLNQNKKFSRATLAAASRTYCCVWTLYPKSETIVVEAEGIAIDGIGDRLGKRHLPRGQQEGREIELHEDAKPAGDLSLEKAEATFNLNL
eukprot:jgi/Psemu1/7027/gm1.7027_g